MATLTGKTIGELALLTGITSDTLFAVELSGATYHIPYSGLSTGDTTPTLEQVLTQGNSTGGVAIISPDGLTELTCLDTQAGLYCTDAIDLVNSIYVSTAKIDYVAQDNTSNDVTHIEQQATNLSLQNTSAGGNQVNSVSISQTKVGIENNLNGTQIQEIYVDLDTCNMRYADGLNIIDVELGLTNGFKATQTVDSGDFENFLQVKFDKIQLVYNDIAGGINHELKVDADGYFLNNLPAYQDDTDAGTAGVPQGYLYQTNGLGASPLNVAGILMIKQ
jgi:hypothetical protein